MGNVRIINSKGQVKFVPEGITKASWFIKSDWQVQDLKVEQKVIVNEEIQEGLDDLFEASEEIIIGKPEELESNTKKTPKNKK